MDETDNENEMVIDTTPNSKANPKSKGRVRKRKRISSSSADEYVLPDNTLEVEKTLHASALKNNLDPTDVKKIIKSVVTNDHVIALVKMREEEEGSSTDEDVSTLTRSKAKTVKKIPRVTAPWNLQLEPIEHIPVKTRPEVEALIAQELPEDEDDEEYEPTNDDIPSDDDHILESCSDLDSQPRTPATPRSQIVASPKVAKDGPFKIPQEVSGACRRLPMEEEATIALRTRSKLSLSATPIEHIEGSFVPPDEPPACDVDEVWSAFLRECLGPAPAARHDDDDDDPEYNVAADPDANEDEEGLENSLIKISKKELEDILTELCQVIPGQPAETANGTGPQTTQDKIVDAPLHWEGKQEPVSDEDQKQPVVAAKIQHRHSSARLSIGKTEPLDDEEVVEQPTCTQDVQIQQKSPPRDVTLEVESQEVRLVSVVGSSGVGGATGGAGEGAPPAVVQLVTSSQAQVVRVDVDGSPKFLPEQLLLLQQQLRQHVQLAASNFLQLCVHPVHWASAPPFREYLESLISIADSRPGSVVDVCNLRPALELINAYERSVTEVSAENAKMVQFISEEMEKMQSSTTHKYVYRGNFPDTFRRVVANSSVFVYPHLLPPSPFRPGPLRRRFAYLRSEDELIAMGLDQFRSYVEANPGLFPRKVGTGRRRGLHAAAALVSKHMMPWIPTKTLTSHIAVVRKSGDQNNPINKFLKTGAVEPVKHKLLPFNPKLTLYEQPEYEMPRSWVSYLAKSSKRFRSYLYRRTHITGPPPSGVELDFGGKLVTPQKPPLPTDFTETYTCNRTSNGARKPNERNDIQTYAPIQIESSFFNVVSTKEGVLLLPVSQTNTVNVNKAPIPAPVEVKPFIITIDSGRIDMGKNTHNNTQNNTQEKIMSKPEVNTETNHTNKERTNEELHCECCVLIRKICRVRQTYMTEYIRNSKFKKRTCPCSEVKFPKVSNKLKLLLKYYWPFSKTVYNKVKKTFEDLSAGVDITADDVEAKNEEKDVVFVISFLIKLTIRMNMTRTHYSKTRIDETFNKFDVLTGDPLYLAADLRAFLEAPDIDLYREFMGFLTAEQADRLDKFRDHFIVNCVDDLLKKVEEEIPERARRCSVTEQLRQAFVGVTSACELCCMLLRALPDHPALAAHAFRLFPHRRTKTNNSVTNNNIEKDANVTDCNIQKDENITTRMIQNVEKDAEKTESPIKVPKPVLVKVQADSDDEEETPARTNNSVTNNNIEKDANVTDCNIQKDENITTRMIQNVEKDAEKTESPIKVPKPVLVKVQADSDDEEETPASPNEKCASSDGGDVNSDSGLNICEDTNMDECYEDDSSSDNTSDMDVDMNETELTVKEEPPDTYEITITDTEVQRKNNLANGHAQRTSGDYETSLRIVIEEETIKSESPEWKREEDKLILEIIKQYLTQEELKNKTINEVIDAKSEMLLECFGSKSIVDIKERVVHLLQFVNSSK